MKIKREDIEKVITTTMGKKIQTITEEGKQEYVTLLSAIVTALETPKKDMSADEKIRRGMLAIRLVSFDKEISLDADDIKRIIDASEIWGTSVFFSIVKLLDPSRIDKLKG